MALTAAQIEAIKDKLVKFGQLATFKSQCDSAYQGVINDLSTIRSGAGAGATAYQKPDTGIPSTDLAQTIQNALAKAVASAANSDLTDVANRVAALEALIESDSDDTINKFNEITAFLEGIHEDGKLSDLILVVNKKYTKPTAGIPAEHLTEAVQTSLGKADTALQPVSGKGLSANDYDNTAKDKVDDLYYAEDLTVSSLIGSTINSTAQTKLNNLISGWRDAKLLMLHADYCYIPAIVEGITGTPKIKFVFGLNYYEVSKSGSSWGTTSKSIDASDKVTAVSGKGLSTNDFNNTYKGILDGMTYCTDAEVQGLFS